MRKTQSFSFYLPEDALHEILIKLAPYTLYYFDSVDGRRRCTIGILMPDLSSFINRQLKAILDREIKLILNCGMNAIFVIQFMITDFMYIKAEHEKIYINALAHEHC